MGTQNRGTSSVRALTQIEQMRTQQQALLDTVKHIEKRRHLGQYATPPALAREIAAYGLKLLGNIEPIRFLEPAIGTGAFFSALLSETKDKRMISAIGYEIDPDYGNIAKMLWKNEIQIYLRDFTKAKCRKKSINLLLSNPPYIRHHYISQQDKIVMGKAIYHNLGITISGLTGMHCYFMLLAHPWLDDGAISGWLIPSEFMDVNYGSEIKNYLLNKVHLLRIHQYNPENMLFEDALVSSSVVWFRKEQVEEDYEVEFSYGGSHDKPEMSKKVLKSVLLKEHKWTRFPSKEERVMQEQMLSLKDFFTVKRGLATGDNNFFILSREQIENSGIDIKFFIPILPSPRNLRLNIIESDEMGYPIMEPQYFLLNCSLTEEEIKGQQPKLWEYLKTGLDSVATKYLCKSRRIWYFQETRMPAPILCTYMGRKASHSGNPFRFILNKSKAIATNSYLMLYPKENVKKAIKENPKIITDIWNSLNSISAESMEGEGRVYGGGLKKIEPKELGEVKCANLQKLLNQ